MPNLFSSSRRSYFSLILSNLKMQLQIILESSQFIFLFSHICEIFFVDLAGLVKIKIDAMVQRDKIKILGSGLFSQSLNLKPIFRGSLMIMAVLVELHPLTLVYQQALLQVKSGKKFQLNGFSATENFKFCDIANS